MLYRTSLGAAALVAALCATTVDSQAWDDTGYPDLKGQWVRAEGARGVGRFDPTKPPGRLQEAPLTAEYQAIYSVNQLLEGDIARDVRAQGLLRSHCFCRHADGSNHSKA